MNQQYFSQSSPARADEVSKLIYSVRGHDFDMSVSSKVFSTSRLDLGTRQLLAEAPCLPTTGTFLDVGCGWGPIALAMAKEAPEATVWAVDVNDRAIDLTRRNAASHGCTNVRAMSEDEALATVATDDVRFDVIWSNPPIRIGKEALHTLLVQWLGRLSPMGVAYLVVQRNLGADSLISWLNGRGYVAEKCASKKGYRIIEVRPGT